MRRLTSFSSVKQSWENAKKMAAHGVFLLINPEGGVGFGEAVEGEKRKNERRKVLKSTLISASEPNISSRTVCGVHTHAKLIAQEVEQTIPLKSRTASIRCLLRGGKWKPDV